VRAWLEENEQQTGGTILLRPQKLNALKAAKKALTKERGGRQALMAAITILCANGEATLSQEPTKPRRRGKNRGWRQESVEWMVERGWLRGGEEADLTLAAAEQHHSSQELKETKYLMVDFGEGWGSVGRAIREMDPEVEVVGLDRRGLTYTGTKHGVITSAVNHDFSRPVETVKESIRRTLERKVGRSAKQWVIAWMSPECTLWSQGNYMNQTKGAARGLKAMLPKNVSAAAPGRLAQESELTEGAKRGVTYLITFLEETPGLLFAVENPMTSDMWKLPEVREAMQRNPEWHLTTVDQCAYGRASQKPTRILHNTQWKPRGITGNGRCAAGKCAGTEGNKPGNRMHREQTIPATKDRKPNQGKLTGGKREHTLKAVVNAVQAQLVQEIYSAAKQQFMKRQRDE
jgi:hypothetical protein